MCQVSISINQMGFTRAVALFWPLIMEMSCWNWRSCKSRTAYQSIYRQLRSCCLCVTRKRSCSYLAGPIKSIRSSSEFPDYICSFVRIWCIICDSGQINGNNMFALNQKINHSKYHYLNANLKCFSKNTLQIMNLENFKHDQLWWFFFAKTKANESFDGSANRMIYGSFRRRKY